MSTSIYDDIVSCRPHLRDFARSLTGERSRADDLVQYTVLRALSAANQFTLGMNFKVWIFAILRNLYFNEFRRYRAFMRPLELADLETQANEPTRCVGREIDDHWRAFGALSIKRREALMLVGVDGFRYKEAAAICGCPVGTIKSRVARARREIETLLGTGGMQRRTGNRRSEIVGGEGDSRRKGPLNQAQSARGADTTISAGAIEEHR